MKKIDKKSIPLIVMLSLFLSMGLIGWFGVVPFQKFTVEKADEIQKYHAEKENRERQLKKLPDLEHQYEAILADEEELDVLLPESKIVDFVKILEEMAAESKVEIVIKSDDKGEIQEKKAVKAPPRKAGVTAEEEALAAANAPKVKATIMESIPYDRYLPLSITVKGEYADIVIFLHKLETLPYALDVVGLVAKLLPKEEEKAAQNAPDRKNPFSLSLGNNVISSGTTTEDAKKVVTEGRTEATFETVVYVSKE